MICSVVTDGSLCLTMANDCNKGYCNEVSWWLMMDLLNAQRWSKERETIGCAMHNPSSHGLEAINPLAYPVCGTSELWYIQQQDFNLGSVSMVILCYIHHLPSAILVQVGVSQLSLFMLISMITKAIFCGLIWFYMVLLCLYLMIVHSKPATNTDPAVLGPNCQSWWFVLNDQWCHAVRWTEERFTMPQSYWWGKPEENDWG